MTTTTYGISPAPILQFFNNAGQPNAGGSILTQVGGVNYATYQDSAGATPLPNPIPLNSRGEVSNSSGQSCQLFLEEGVVYEFTLFDANGNQINQAQTVEAVPGGSAGPATTAGRLVVVSDSGPGAGVLGIDWPAQLEEMLRLWGVPDIEVVTVAQPNGTFYRALNNTDMGGVTALQATIDLAPAMVLIVLGFNDANGSDGRTLAQIEGDAQSFISQLATALPKASIYYGKQIGYDTTHGTPGSLLNRQVIPRIWTIPTSGTDSATISQDIAANTAVQANTTFSTLSSLQAYVAGLSQVTGSFTMDYYKIGRMGLMVDGEHLYASGMRLLACEALDGLQSLSVFKNMRTNSQSWQYWDLQSLWSSFFSDTGTDWALNFTTTPEYFAVPFYNALWHAVYSYSATWMNQAHIGLTVQSKDAVQLSADDFLFLTVRDALPGTKPWIRWWLSGTTKPALGSAGTAQINAVDPTGTLSYLVRGTEFTSGAGTYNVEIVQLVGSYYDCSERLQITVIAPATQPTLRNDWIRCTMAGGTTVGSTDTLVGMTSVIAQSSVGGMSLSAGGIKVTYAGVYRASADVLIAPTGTGTVAAAISVNSVGTHAAQLGRQYLGTSGARLGFAGSQLISLNAGDTVLLDCLSASGGSVVDEGNSAWNNLCLEGPLLP